jgi:hypothetical protein
LRERSGRGHAYDMRAEHDFRKGERGKFYRFGHDHNDSRPSATRAGIRELSCQKAEKKGVSLVAMAADILETEVALMQRTGRRPGDLCRRAA